MNPLTPDHHFYIDQGTNARLRLVASPSAASWSRPARSTTPRTWCSCTTTSCALLHGRPAAFDARELVSDRRDEQEDASELRPPSWVGTATEEALAFPYNALWGFPEKFHAGEPATTGEIKGLAASPGVVEGPARYVDLARRVRPGRAGRHPRLPDDEPGVGRAVHEDQRAGHRGGRRGVAPGGGRPRVRHPGRRRHDATRATGSRPATASASTARRASSSCCPDEAGSLRRRSRRHCRSAPSTATARRCSPAGRSSASS